MWISFLQNISFRISIYLIRLLTDRILSKMGRSSRKNKTEKKQSQESEEKEKKPKLEDVKHVKMKNIEHSKKDQFDAKPENRNVKLNWDDDTDIDAEEKPHNVVQETSKDVRENNKPIVEFNKPSGKKLKQYRRNQDDSDREMDCEPNISAKVPSTQSSAKEQSREKKDKKKIPNFDDVDSVKIKDIVHSKKDLPNSKSETLSVKQNSDDEHVNDTDKEKRQRKAVNKTLKEEPEKDKSIEECSRPSGKNMKKSKPTNNLQVNDHEMEYEENEIFEVPSTQPSANITESKSSEDDSKKSRRKRKKKPKNNQDPNHELEPQGSKIDYDVLSTQSDETELIEDRSDDHFKKPKNKKSKKSENGDQVEERPESNVDQPVSTTQSNKTKSVQNLDEIHSEESKESEKSKKDEDRDEAMECQESEVEPVSSAQSNNETKLSEEWNAVNSKKSKKRRKKSKKHKDDEMVWVEKVIVPDRSSKESKSSEDSKRHRSKKHRDDSSQRKEHSRERNRRNSSDRKDRSQKDVSSNQKDHSKKDENSSPHQKLDKNSSPLQKNESRKQDDSSKKDRVHDSDSGSDQNKNNSNRAGRRSHQSTFEDTFSHQKTSRKYPDNRKQNGPSKNVNQNENRGAPYLPPHRRWGQTQFGPTSGDNFYPNRKTDYQNGKFYQNRDNYKFPREQNSQFKKKSNKQPLFVVNPEYYEPTIREVEGDLFDVSEEYSLGHCVAEDLSMGAGIAVEFKKRFKGVKELWNQNKRTGEVAILQRDGRYIFYIITKPRSNGKPTLESLEKSVLSLKKSCLEFKVKKLAIPRIGSGLDRLDWDHVKDILYNTFKDTDIEILVHVL